ncbi:MAG: histidine phosphatase family protein [Clostridia bacterium]|nr:histidine phosphatase family protein [Clostridia bacterium]NCC44711.1 histidine phosphatase family protein [Clostridia bacterium]
MKIYITRHGETSWNLEDKVCGRPDVELTDLGRRQAMELAEKVKGKGITRMLVSPLGRAQETARLANAYIQVPMQIEERLIEHSFGDYEGAPRKDPGFQAAKRNLTARFPGGESILEAVHRVYNVLDEIPEKYPNDTILLVCHGAVSRYVHTYFEDIALEDFARYSLKNCELKEYHYFTRADISLKRG